MCPLSRSPLRLLAGFSYAADVYKRQGWPEKYLLVSFGLDYKKDSPRIIQAVEAGRRRWTHHVLVEGKNGIDEELMQWIDEAYRFSLFK